MWKGNRMKGRYPFKKINNKPVCTGPVNEQKCRDWAKIPEGGEGWMTIEYDVRPKTYSQVKLIWGNMIANTIIQAQEKDIDVGDIMVYLLSKDKLYSVSSNSSKEATTEEVPFDEIADRMRKQQRPYQAA